MVGSKKTINSYQKMEKSKELMKKWNVDNPEFDNYEEKLDELLVWESDSFSQMDWDEFYNCSTLDELEQFIKYTPLHY